MPTVVKSDEVIFNVVVPKALRQRLKVEAANRGVTLRELVEEAFENELRRRRAPDLRGKR